jgi:hypothetical protein
VTKAMPEGPHLGMSYARPIMDKADKEVKDSWRESKTGQ